MCGRYTLSSPKQRLIEGFLVREWFEGEYPPRYNAAPSQWLPIVRVVEGVRRLDLLRWGLIPPWAKDLAIGYRMINARGETVADKPAYRAAYRRRRCLAPVNGFYEWRRGEGRDKRPYLIRCTGGAGGGADGLMGLAALWEHWQGEDGTEIESYTILTTTPNELVSDLHDRMPVIIPAESYDRWLDHEAPLEDIQAMLRPFPAERMTCYEVAKRVGNPRVDDASLIEPVESGGLFG